MSKLKSIFPEKYNLVFVFVGLFILWVIIYISIHSLKSQHQGRKVSLEGSDIEAISQLYKIPNDQLINIDSLEKYYFEIMKSEFSKSEDSVMNSQQQDSIIQDKVDSVSIGLALVKRTELINQYLSSIDITYTFNVSELETAMQNLSQRRFIVESYFFLMNRWVLLEILMFAMMGVICNALYYMTEFIRKNEFDPNETVVYIVKLFYTPIVVLIIYMGAEQFLGQSKNTLPTPSNTIVLSFVLGFFSGRAIELLTRIKDAFFPANAENNSNKAETDKPDPFRALSFDEQERVVNEFIDSEADTLLIKFPNIKGLSAEHKNGDEKEPICLLVDLDSKLPDDQVDTAIPKTYLFKDSKGITYNIPTDIAGVGEYKALGSGKFIGEGVFPKELGLSCSRENSNNTGTIGLKVYKNNIPYLLSCFHVLCSKEFNSGKGTYSKANASDFIISPSEEDRKTNLFPLAELSEGVLNHYVDAAIAKLSDTSLLENKYYDVNGVPSGIRKLTKEDKEKKIWLKVVGRTSGVKWGRLKTNYKNRVFIEDYKHVLKNGELRDVIIAENISCGGDSGATVMDSDSKIIGIITAGNCKTESIIVPIETVINHLNIDKPFKL